MGSIIKFTNERVPPRNSIEQLDLIEYLKIFLNPLNDRLTWKRVLKKFPRVHGIKAKLEIREYFEDKEQLKLVSEQIVSLKKKKRRKNKKF